MSGTGSANAPQGTTIAQFLELLEKSNLLKAEEFQAVATLWPAEKRGVDAQNLAKELVAQEKLTKYQAAALYQGKLRGLQLGPYRVLDRLGTGGMGTVFKAVHIETGELAAVKVMPSASSKSADAVKRFQREAQAAAALNHPNIVRSLGTGEHDKQLYFAMEFVDGLDLSNLVRTKGPLQPLQAGECVLQAARGLTHAHEQGIVHRDIKPGNLVLNREGQVKVLDLGLARFSDPSSAAAAQADEGLTQTGQVMGTVDYMAPEQALNTRLADARSDIYSLGCTLYRLIVGQNPYHGESVVEKILAHRQELIPSIRKSVPSAPEALDQVFRRAVAKKPEDRFQKMSEFADALERSLKGGAEGTVGVAPIMLKPLALAIPTAEDSSNSSLHLGPKSHPPKTLPSPGKKHTTLALAGVGVLLLVAAIVVLSLPGEPAGGVPVVTDNNPVEPTPQPGGDTKPVEVKPVEVKPVDTKVVDTKVVDTKPVEPTPVPPTPQPVTLIGQAPPPSTVAPLSATIPVTSSLSPAQVQRERTIAEWIVAHNGQVSYRIVGQTATPAPTRQLPSEPFEVFRIIFTSSFNGTDLSMLTGLGKVQSLTLTAAQVRDTDFAHIAELTTLRNLNLFSIRFASSSLAQLKSLRDLQELKITSNPAVTVASLEPLAQLPHVRRMELRGVRLSDADASRLAALFPLLETLEVGESFLTDAGLAALARLSHLKVLSLSQTSITNNCAASLEKFTALEHLVLDRNRVGDPIVPALVKLPRLVVLFINGAQFTRAGYEQLQSALPKLRITPSSPPLNTVVDNTLPSRPAPPTAGNTTTVTHGVPVDMLAVVSKSLANDDVWKVEGSTLVSALDRSKTINIDGLPTNEYTLRMVVERRDGTGSFTFGMPNGVTHPLCVVDSKSNSDYGVSIQSFDHPARGLHSVFLTNLQRELSLRPGVRTVIECEVLTDRLTIAVGERRVYQRQGNMAETLKTPASYQGDLHSFTFSTSGAAIVIHKLEYLPVTKGGPQIATNDTSKQPTPVPMPDPAPPTPPAPSPVTPPSAVSNELPAIPDEAALAEARKAVRDLFKSELAQAKKPEERVALGTKMLEQARLVQQDSAGKYAMLIEARELASETGEADLLKLIAVAARESFKLDFPSFLADGFDAALKRTLPPATSKKLVTPLNSYVQAAVDEEDYELAKRFMDLTLTAARKANDAALQRTMVERGKNLDRDRAQFEVIRKAREKLLEAPDDPVANLTLGKHHCFIAGEWKLGFPKLAKGNDAVLKELGELSAETGTEHDEMVKTADEWWDRSEKAGGQMKKDIKLGALYWYEQCATAATGLAKAKIEKRMNEARTLLGSVTTLGTSKSKPVTPSVFNTTVPAPPSTTPAAVAKAPGKLTTVQQQMEWLFSVGLHFSLQADVDNNRRTRTIRTPSDVQGQPILISSVIVPNAQAYNPSLLGALADFTSLTTLTFENSPVGDNVFAEIAKLPQLETLNIRFSRQTFALGLQQLKGLTRLRRVDFSSSSISDATLHHLSALPALESVELSTTPITDVGVAELAKCKELTFVRIAYVRTVSDRGYQQLAALPRLRTLDIAYGSAGDGVLEGFGNSTSIDYINFSGAQVTDASLRVLGQMTNLRSCSFFNTRITDAGLAAMTKNTTIRSLTLTGCRGISVAAVNQLRQAIPQCRISFGTN